MPNFKIAPNRATQREYDSDFDAHQNAIRAEGKEREKLAAEVASLKKQLSDLQSSIARVSASSSRSSVASSGSSGFTGTVGATQGGTGITGYAVGDMLYASAINALSALPIGTALQELRTNAGATAPEWFTPSTVYAPVWTRYTITEADLNALSGSSDFTTLLTLAAKTLIHAVVIKHSASFTGGTVASCTVSVGISGNATKYAPAFDIFQATGNTVSQVSSVVGMEDYAAGTVIRASFVTTGDTLANLTAGSVDIWVLAGTLP